MRYRAISRLLRRTGDPLRDELAISWRALLLVLTLAVIGLTASVPILSLRRPDAPAGTALALEPVPDMGPVVTWTAEAAGPSSSRLTALGDLFPVLVAVAWAALAIALIAMLGRLVAQSYERGPEVGIRRAVGASRADILAAQLAEAAVGGAAALAVALPLGYLVLRMAVRTWPGPTSGAQWAPGSAVGLVAAVLAIGALLPLAHRSARRLVGGDPMPVTLGVPALQICASVAVLTAGAVMLRHAREVGSGNGAPETAAGMMWEIDAVGSDAVARAGAYGALIGRMDSEARYQIASLASSGAHSGLGTVDFDVTDCGRCVRGMIVLRWLNLYAIHHTITPDTFAAAGIPVTAGRNLALSDDWDAPRVAVVNRHLAARYFERGDAVGRDIYLGSAWPRTPHRVVGVVDDERAPVLGGAVQPRETVYLSALQHPPESAELVVRVGGAGDGASAGTERLLHAELSRIAAVEAAGTERDRAREAAAPLGWFGLWFGIAGVAALVVALFATFDTVGLWVQSVAGELAMRRAAGATRRRIGLFVARHAAAAVLGGSIAGVLVYTTLVREYLARSISNLPARDLTVAAACTLVLLAAALAGAALATRRFLRTEPARWLR